MSHFKAKMHQILFPASVRPSVSLMELDTYTVMLSARLNVYGGSTRIRGAVKFRKKIRPEMFRELCQKKFLETVASFEVKYFMVHFDMHRKTCTRSLLVFCTGESNSSPRRRKMRLGNPRERGNKNNQVKEENKI